MPTMHALADAQAELQEAADAMARRERKAAEERAEVERRAAAAAAQKQQVRTCSSTSYSAPG